MSTHHIVIVFETEGEPDLADLMTLADHAGAQVSEPDEELGLNTHDVTWTVEKGEPETADLRALLARAEKLIRHGNTRAFGNLTQEARALLDEMQNALYVGGPK